VVVLVHRIRLADLLDERVWRRVVFRLVDLDVPDDEVVAAEHRRVRVELGGGVLGVKDTLAAVLRALEDLQFVDLDLDEAAGHRAGQAGQRPFDRPDLDAPAHAGVHLLLDQVAQCLAVELETQDHHPDAEEGEEQDPRDDRQPAPTPLPTAFLLSQHALVSR